MFGTIENRKGRTRDRAPVAEPAREAQYAVWPDDRGADRGRRTSWGRTRMSGWSSSAVGGQVSARAVILTGCARRLQPTVRGGGRAARSLAMMLHALDRMPKPLIGRIHGQAFGGGVGMMSVCDLTIGVPGPKFGLTETETRPDPRHHQPLCDRPHGRHRRAPPFPRLAAFRRRGGAPDRPSVHACHARDAGWRRDGRGRALPCLCAGSRGGRQGAYSHRFSGGGRSVDRTHDRPSGRKVGGSRIRRGNRRLLPATECRLAPLTATRAPRFPMEKPQEFAPGFG